MKEFKEALKEGNYVFALNLLYDLSWSKEKREELAEMLIDKAGIDKKKFILSTIAKDEFFSSHLREYAGLKLISLCSFKELGEILKDNSFPLQIRDRALQRMKEMLKKEAEEKGPVVDEVCKKIAEAFYVVVKNLEPVRPSLTDIINTMKFRKANLSYEDVKEIIDFFNKAFNDILKNKDHPHHQHVFAIKAHMDLIKEQKEKKREENKKIEPKKPINHQETLKIT